MKMKAALLFEPHTPFVIEEVELAGPKSGEVLVQIKASGVCHSDYHLVTGDTRHPLPVVAGHEGAGIVVEVGAGVETLRPGDPLILNWAPACGQCFYCQQQQSNLCDQFVGPIWAGTMLDGTPRLSYRGRPVYHFSALATFAEYAVVPAASCVPIDRDVPFAIAALVGCAVATGVGAVIYTAAVRPGQSVAVWGCGGVGLNVLQGAALAGAYPIIAIDNNPTKLEMTGRFGATHTLPAGTQAIEAIQQLTAGRGADHLFEVTGLPAVQEQAMEAVRPGGTLTLVGLSPMGSPTNLPGAIIVRRELTIKGSYYGSVSPGRDFPLLLNLYKAGRLKLDALVSQSYPLTQLNEAYAAMLTGSLARGVILP